MQETRAIPRRDEVPIEYTWDLTIVYADEATWEADVSRLEALLPNAAALQGTIAAGADALLRALGFRDRILILAGQIASYAHMKKDSNGADPMAQALDARAGSLYARCAAAVAWIEPEIVALPAGRLVDWQTGEPELAPYAYYLEQLERQRRHVRSAEVEEVVARFADVTRGSHDAYQALTTIDLVFPTIHDEHGQDVQVSSARYASLVSSPDRRVRREAFTALFDTYGSIRTTCAATLAASVRSHVLGAQLHGYPSALTAELDANDIPVDVYHTLLDTVEANLPRLHRYVALRKRLLDLDAVHVYDLYAPLTAEEQVRIPYEEGRRLVREGLAPLGPAYGETLRQALESRWIDVYENQGKRSGAYSNGSYSTPPFVLMNYQGKLRDVYTLAHELGHSMHSHRTRQAQPFISGYYTIFAAEVASTLNETLLTAHLLATRGDAAFRRRLIAEQLDGIRSTIFRQALFARFELDMHRRVEGGEALTADWLSTHYRALVEQYFGPELALDDQVRNEWAYIPHFYRSFYVYQYATGLSAALALGRQILAEGEPAVQRYLRFLASGSSRPTIDLLRDAGVDMATPAPIQAAMDYFDGLLDQLETP